MRLFGPWLLLLIHCKVFGFDLKPTSPPIPPKPESSEPTKKLTFSENFHLSFQYNSGTFNLNLADPNSLDIEPQSGLYEDGKPVSGIFSGGGLREFRTSLSLLWPFKSQLYSTGIGLSNLELGSPGPHMTKGSSSTSLHINAFTTEFAVLKKIPDFGYTVGSINFDTLIDGRLRSQYLIRSDGSTATIENSLESGYKIGIKGEYHLNFSAGLSIGINGGLQYGVLKVKNYMGKSSLFGFSYGMNLLLLI